LVESDEHRVLHQLIPFSVDVQPVGGKRKVYRGKPSPASAFAAPNFHFPLRDFEGDALVADRFCKRPDGRRQRVEKSDPAVPPPDASAAWSIRRSLRFFACLTQAVACLIAPPDAALRNLSFNPTLIGEHDA
jgi:hypothetical protein